MENENIIISYLTLRKWLGVLGMALAPLLVITTLIVGDCDTLLSSISIYYYSTAGDILVGVLSSIAVFLFAYKGYEKKDDMAANLAAISALGIGFFPTTADLSGVCPVTIDNNIIGIIHFICGILFFLVLAYMCLFLFTKSSNDPTPEKQMRNKVYKVCGYGIVACLVFLGLYFAVLEEIVPRLAVVRPVFMLEALSLLFFGVAWITKGEVWLTDKQGNSFH